MIRQTTRARIYAAYLSRICRELGIFVAPSELEELLSRRGALPVPPPELADELEPATLEPAEPVHFEPCTCETIGRCAPCEASPTVRRNRGDHA